MFPVYLDIEQSLGEAPNEDLRLIINRRRGQEINQEKQPLEQVAENVNDHAPPTRAIPLGPRAQEDGQNSEAARGLGRDVCSTPLPVWLRPLPSLSSGLASHRSEPGLFPLSKHVVWASPIYGFDGGGLGSPRPSHKHGKTQGEVVETQGQVVETQAAPSPLE
ncbi:hypothetical protein Salat_1548400 [Sesamum alatum]|uniref:Uncharacterized protein n=1 Tax=Sesamum alatum TaxID=300844 RepID=A0AAE1YCN0_9LAMI|nr:hypothetical protein Salat_1548400 [Sesamum alatum]